MMDVGIWSFPFITLFLFHSRDINPILIWTHSEEKGGVHKRVANAFMIKHTSVSIHPNATDTNARADSRMPGTSRGIGETVKTVNLTFCGSHTKLKQGVNEISHGFLNPPCTSVRPHLSILKIGISLMLGCW